MKIGIQDTGKNSFSNRWVEYCNSNNIGYKIVNAYSSNIIEQLKDCDAFMWHFHHGNYKDMLFAKQLLYSLENSGKQVFPNYRTCWHFDDKVGQKYLLEAIEAPLVHSYVFYTKNEAIEWINKATFPKVFKLRGGAGAINVQLAKTKKDAIRLTNRAFGKGFIQYDWYSKYKEELRNYKLRRNTLRDVLRPIYYSLKPNPTEFAKFRGNEKGYVYFQDFIPNNNYDIRLIVIGGKYAYGLRRINRQNDFRASGSSNFKYDNIPIKVVEVAFKTSQKLNLQSCAFDFIFENENPLIVEMSYGFGTKGSGKSPGYWTSDLQWHEGEFNPYGWMIENILNE